MRENINNLSQLYFRGCENCSECCEGKFFLAPLILEDFDKVKKYFEIRAIILDEIIPVMLLTDGKNPCKYLKDNRCSIYEERPPACKIYPFSPFYDDIFIDLSCPAVGDVGDKLPTNKKEYFKSDFFEERFINFKIKRENTINFMKCQKLIFDKEIKGIKLYKFEI
jgi:Fe-S-cluster containining protein